MLYLSHTVKHFISAVSTFCSSMTYWHILILAVRFTMVTDSKENLMLIFNIFVLFFCVLNYTVCHLLKSPH